MAEPGCVHDAHFNNLEVSGNLHIGPSSILAVTQGTSKSTGVPGNGQVVDITMHGAQLNAGATISFILTNSFINSNSIVLTQLRSGFNAAASYTIDIESVSNGSVVIKLNNVSANNLNEAVVVRVIVLGTVG